VNSSIWKMEQGDTLSPTLFCLFVNSMLEEMQAQNLGISINNNWLGALMFANDYVGICESGAELRRMINALHAFARKYRFQANVVKYAVVVFGDSDPVTDQWTWGDQHIPIKDSYVYLGVHFDTSCAWDLHTTEIAQFAMSKLKQLKHVFTNKHRSTETRRTILLAVLKPLLTYARDVWEPTKDVEDLLESVIIDACKEILPCGGDRTSAEAIRGDMGILPLKAERVIQKLKLKYIVSWMPDHRYPKIVTEKSWPSIRIGRQPKVWSCMMSDLLKKYLPHVDVQLLEEPSYMQQVKDCVYAHESLNWEVIMRGKEKLQLYLDANEAIEFKPYLKGFLYLGTKLMFRMRAGKVALNGMLYKPNRQHDPSCPCYASKCEDVVHTLIDCPVYCPHREHVMTCLHSVIGSAAYHEFACKSPSAQAVCILSPKGWHESHQPCICQLAKEFPCMIWHCRACKVNGPLTLAEQIPSSPQNASASIGGAEVYGQLTTTPNT
jgi:hypothetical protein